MKQVAVGSVRCCKEKREVCVVWTCCAYELGFMWLYFSLLPHILIMRADLARSAKGGGAVCELTINNFFSLEHKNV